MDYGLSTVPSFVYEKSLSSQILIGLVGEGNYYITFLRKTDLQINDLTFFSIPILSMSSLGRNAIGKSHQSSGDLTIF